MRALVFGSCLVLLACSDKSNQGPAAAEIAAAAAADVGKPAPDFMLKDLDGKEVKLSSFKGKTVVLEWFNPECPFVKKSHTKGSLKGYAESVAPSGVVWLTINSGAPGKQGAGVDVNKKGAESFGLKNPVLLDEDGKVGKLYGATNTPHMYVIDPEGVLVYAGAIDNSPDGEGESPEGGQLVNYVSEALAAVAAKQPVAKAKTRAYGCSVKYAN
jgi:peroxiredoxin